ILGSRRRNDLAVGSDGRFADQKHGVLIVRIGIVGIGVDGSLECGSGGVHLPGIHQHSAEIVIVLTRARRIELGGFRQLGLGVVELLGFGERQSKVIVVGRFVRLELDSLLVVVRGLVQIGGLLRTGLGAGAVLIGVGQIRKDYVLGRRNLVRLLKA